MGVTSQVADQPAGLAGFSRSVTVTDPGGALDVFVGAHVIHERNEAVIEHGKISAENFLGSRNRWTFCLGH